MNKKKVLRLGYHVVKRRGQKELDDEVTINEGKEAEMVSPIDLMISYFSILNLLGLTSTRIMLELRDFVQSLLFCSKRSLKMDCLRY